MQGEGSSSEAPKTSWHALGGGRTSRTKTRGAATWLAGLAHGASERLPPLRTLKRTRRMSQPKGASPREALPARAPLRGVRSAFVPKNTTHQRQHACTNHATAHAEGGRPDGPPLPCGALALAAREIAETDKRPNGECESRPTSCQAACSRLPRVETLLPRDRAQLSCHVRVPLAPVSAVASFVPQSSKQLEGSSVGAADVFAS